MPAFLATAFLVGLAGGVHCVVMCGGIVAALGLRAPRPGARAAGQGVLRPMAYSLGRVTTYTCLGAAAGGLGGLGLRAADVLPVQAAMLVIANALVILLGLNLAGLGTAALAFDRVGSIVWRGVRRLGARLAPAQSPVGAVGVGVAWGFLPCGLVYGVLATALVSGSAARGALVMAAFGLGTLPNLLAAGFAAEALSRFVSRPRVRLAAGLGVVLLGVIGLMRIPGLHEHLRHGLHSMH